MEIDFTLLFVVSIVTLTGGIVGVKVASLRHLEPNIVKNKLDYYKELIEEHKKDANYWRGKFSKTKQEIQVEGDYDLNDPSAITSLAKSILPAILEFLPKNVQDKAKVFLDNPELIDLAKKLYDENPEQIKSLLGSFIKGGSKLFNKESELTTDQATSGGA